MARRSWASLSTDYKSRLERQGISREMHEAGESIRKARGHENTPERPSQGIKNPGDFGEWFRTREQLVSRVIARKSHTFGSSKKFNAQRSAKYVREGYPGHKPPSISKLQWAVEATAEEWHDALVSGDEDFAFLNYH